MEKEKQTVFRKKTIEQISSPEQLTDYLSVTNPGIWVILAAVILLLAGIFAWCLVGTLETKAEVKVVVTDQTAQVIAQGSEVLTEGMPLHVSDQDVLLTSVETDEYGRSTGRAELILPDGTYDGTVITETMHPISFLLESR